ncbi:glutaredoxin [Halohasta litchfieldiae]|jgi:glutaredoxin|uniref:Glutaredoxin n=1 Tax=Halohasta litchfieldiae TaxID=1073996 RepID=A0A1H6V5P1_9EURY|nr:glutaredoxin [Halohasta litchfieldiae]ATW88381.1 glutaredoxin [Halohasta litchfieldiae]SEI95612.1 Glutaredoxin [Halohasta litchfieldiae]
MPTLTLYDRPDCPYSKRVRRVLDVLSIEYEEVIVPEARADREELDSLTGQRGVPVLVDNDHPNGWVADSGDISSYLKNNYDTTAATQQ